jgi:hypothetical protein
MRLLKSLTILFTSILLSSCTSLNSNTSTSSGIEVERITTTEPNVRTTINDSCMLNYTIYPYNATDKSITVDTSNLDSTVATITVDDYNYVFVWGKAEGTGSLRLITSNGKSVSYNITVIDPEPIPDPDSELSTIDKIAKYYNEKAAASEYDGVYYYDSLHYWWNEYDFGHCAEPSQQVLGLPVQIFKSFLPEYMFRYDEKYDGTEHRLVMVNSNISAACEIYSYIEDETLIVEVVIYNVW